MIEDVVSQGRGKRLWLPICIFTVWMFYCATQDVFCPSMFSVDLLYNYKVVINETAFFSHSQLTTSVIMSLTTP